MKQIIVYDLTKAEDINDYYRSFLTGDADKDQHILDMIRKVNNHRTVERLAGMMERKI